MTYRLYSVNLIADPRRPQKRRSALSRYITEDGTGLGFWERGDQRVSPRLTLARCDAATHARIEQDPDITALSAAVDSMEQLVGDNVIAPDTIELWGDPLRKEAPRRGPSLL